MNPDRLSRIVERYTRIYKAEPEKNGSFDAIEAELDVRLPQDMREIGSFYSGGIVGPIEHLSFRRGKGANVLDVTASYRDKLGLPDGYVILSAPPGSIIVLETDRAQPDASRVLWLDDEDAFRLARNEPMQYEVTEFPDYATFFEFMVAEAE